MDMLLLYKISLKYIMDLWPRSKEEVVKQDAEDMLNELYRKKGGTPLKVDQPKEITWTFNDNIVEINFEINEKVIKRTKHFQWDYNQAIGTTLGTHHV